MRAGRRKNRIIIERYTAAQDAFGAEVPTWTALKSVWAFIKPSGGGEKIQGGAVDATLTHTINIRFTDITAADRINDKGRIYNISRVLNLDEGRKEIELEVVEVV